MYKRQRYLDVELWEESPHGELAADRAHFQPHLSKEIKLRKIFKNKENKEAKPQVNKNKYFSYLGLFKKENKREM